MKRHPAGAGCDDDPRSATEDRRRGDVPVWDRAVVVPFSCRRLNSPFGSLRRSENASDGLKRSLCLSIPYVTVPLAECTERASECTVPSSEVTVPSDSTAEIGTEAAETLRCARSGGPGPSAEAAATSERERAQTTRGAVTGRSRSRSGECQLAGGGGVVPRDGGIGP